MSYKHLSLEERCYLEIAKKAGKTLTEIASDMDRSQSTLSRELIHNTGQRGYRHKQAMRLAQERHATKPKQVKLTESVKERITSFLRKDWSPEQIAGRLSVKGEISLHHETIYQLLTPEQTRSYLPQDGDNQELTSDHQTDQASKKGFILC